MFTLTKSDLPRMAQRLRRPVDVLLLATARAQLERERVDPIQRRVLAELGYEKHEPKQSYLLPDDVAARYFERLNEIHLAEGFEQAKDGFCPALVAEHLQVQAEWALIEAAQEFLPEIDNNRLLCGTKEKNGLELRQEYIDLLIGLVVNSPGYKSPLK